MWVLKPYCPNMIKFSILFAAFLVVIIFPITAQSRVERLAEYVVDSNTTQTEQAREIYNWITTNISYDVKAFEKFDNSEKSIDEILSSRKGLCRDFANLFSEMCNSVGIEAYVIGGYSKNLLHFKGKPFIRTNHAWNVFYTDSTWHIVDATWGSGYIGFKPNLLSKVANVLIRAPYSNDKAYFIPEQNFKYFDISYDSLNKTHYPLDPKWQLTGFPLSYQYFETDSLPKHFQNETFKKDIEGIRHRNFVEVYKADAIKGNQVNRNNYFDLANSYWLSTIAYDIERPVSESNIWQFEKYLSEYAIIVQSINRHKAIADSLYRSRFKSLKTVAATQKRMTGKIKSKTKSAQKSFKSGKQQIIGKDASYRKKQETFMINIGRTELKMLTELEGTDSAKIDIQELNSLNKEVEILEMQKNRFIQSSDSLMNSIGMHIKADALYDDSIYTENNKFNLNIVSLNNLILTGNEALIRSYVDSLNYIYGEIAFLLEQKKGAKSKLQETTKLYYSQTAVYQKVLKEQMGLLDKMYKMSNYSDSIFKRYTKCTDDLIASYRQNIDFTQKIANHGLMQKDIRKENLEALKQQKKNIVRENKYFQKWYKNLYDKEVTEYNNEKELVKTIKTNAQRNQKLVETKLLKYKDLAVKSKQ